MYQIFTQLRELKMNISKFNELHPDYIVYKKSVAELQRERDGLYGENDPRNKTYHTFNSEERLVLECLKNYNINELFDPLRNIGLSGLSAFLTLYNNQSLIDDTKNRIKIQGDTKRSNLFDETIKCVYKKNKEKEKEDDRISDKDSEHQNSIDALNKSFSKLMEDRRNVNKETEKLSTKKEKRLPDNELKAKIEAERLRNKRITISLDEKMRKQKESLLNKNKELQEKLKKKDIKQVEKDEKKARQMELREDVKTSTDELDKIKKEKELIQHRLDNEISEKMDNYEYYLDELMRRKSELEDKELDYNNNLQNKIYELKLMKKLYEEQNRKKEVELRLMKEQMEEQYQKEKKKIRRMKLSLKKALDEKDDRDKSAARKRTKKKDKMRVDRVKSKLEATTKRNKYLDSTKV